MSDLIKYLDNVLEFCSSNYKKKSIKCSSLQAKIATQHLLVISKYIKSKLNLNELNYDFSVSYGSGYFPKVPWVAITVKGKKVSNSISVCICFAKEGHGFVVGAMFSEEKFDGKYKTVKRENEFISLEGGSSRTNYTNKFVNPKDFHKSKFSEQEVLEQLKFSLKLLNEY
jgi:hypothetical protein